MTPQRKCKLVDVGKGSYCTGTVMAYICKQVKVLPYELAAAEPNRFEQLMRRENDYRPSKVSACRDVGAAGVCT